MPLVRMEIKSIVMGPGPSGSLVVLKPREAAGVTGAAKLPIRIGGVEATAISLGIEKKAGGRPLTHDLLANVIEALDAQVESVRITSVTGTTFYAQVEVSDAQGQRHYLDARPSDAIALAVRCGAPLWAEEAVLQTASMPDFAAVEADEKQAELDEFHSFVENLSPEDFDVASEKTDQDGQ